MFLPPTSSVPIFNPLWFGAVGGQCAQLVGLLGSFLGAVSGHIVELDGPRGTFGRGKSSCTCKPLFPFFWPFSAGSTGFGQKRLTLSLIYRFEIEVRHLRCPFPATTVEFVSHSLCGGPSHP